MWTEMCLFLGVHTTMTLTWSIALWESATSIVLLFLRLSAPSLESHSLSSICLEVQHHLVDASLHTSPTSNRGCLELHPLPSQVHPPHILYQILVNFHWEGGVVMVLERFVSRQLLVVYSPEVKVCSQLAVSTWKQGTIESNFITTTCFKHHHVQFMQLMSHQSIQWLFFEFWSLFIIHCYYCEELGCGLFL